MRAALLVALAACSAPLEPVGPDAGLVGDGGSVDAPVLTGTRVADVVVAAPGASGAGFGDPQLAANGIRGGGLANGSIDVYSLSFATRTTITLAWSGDGVLANGPGEDLAVFENPFDTAQGPFMDLVLVEVSRDGTTWRALAADYVTPDETVYVRDRAAWVGFGGKTPVLFHAERNAVDPFDRAQAGGDGFDLDTVVGDDAEAVAIRTSGIRFVRLSTAPSQNNPDTGAPFVRDPYSNGADIDGVYGRMIVVP